MTSADDTEPLRGVSDLQQAPEIQATSRMELETVAVLDRPSLEVSLWGQHATWLQVAMAFASDHDGARDRNHRRTALAARYSK
jgi:hypothetical protein